MAESKKEEKQVFHCSALQCEFSGEATEFFRLPTNSEVRKAEWINRLKIAKINSNTKVCRSHFVFPDDYGKSGTRLLKDVLPTRNLPVG